MIILFIQFLIAPWMNDFVFKVFYKMKKNVELPPYLEEFIHESCQKHHMKYPKIGFIDDGSPNAFTYGRTKNDARVVITRGILELLSEEEVKAVVAHELGHANHYDMLFMTVAQVVPLILYYVADIMLNIDSGHSSRRSSSDSKDSGNYTVIIGAISYVLYIISQYIILWLSRTREYYADHFAIEETKNPTALGDALVKIGFGLAAGGKEERSKVATSANTLGISNGKSSKAVALSAYNSGTVSKKSIVNAMKWERWNVWAKLQELGSTHPLISKRLLAIADQCEAYEQAPYIIFDEEKPESYVDDFFFELFISLLPLLILIIFAVIAIITTNHWLWIGIGGLAFVGSLFFLLGHTHKNAGYKETTVEELLSEVKVSNVTSIPCILEGNIIGRGNPGCIFNEDFVIQDQTGIIFLDYNQPLNIINKIFALFKSKEYFDKKVKVKGWYRRGLVPYVEIYSMEYDGIIKKCHTYTTTKVIYALLAIASIICIIQAL